MQQRVRVFPWLKEDSHRQPLHNLYVIACRILWRQKAEAIPAGAWRVLDVAPIVTTERIDVNCYLLAPMHTGELRFLEVGGYPDLIGLGHEHQGLSRLNSGTKLDGPFADDAIRRGIDSCIAQVEQRLIEGGLCRVSIRLACSNRLERRACGLTSGVNRRRIDSSSRNILIVLLLRHHLLREQGGVSSRISL